MGKKIKHYCVCHSLITDSSVALAWLLGAQRKVLSCAQRRVHKGQSVIEVMMMLLSWCWFILRKGQLQQVLLLLLSLASSLPVITPTEAMQNCELR